MRLSLLPFVLVFLSALHLAAADWPQYRGPKRDDVSTETGLMAKWPVGGPPLLWTYKETGVGYSGVAIVGDRLYTIGARGENEFLIALDLKSAKGQTVTQAWATQVGPTFQFRTNQWTAGPSATPTIDGDLIFALGGNGDLLCVETATGKEVWRKNLPRELEAQINPIGGGPKNLGWGFTWSPLVDGEQVICVPGGPKGTVAALDRKTGRVLWRSVTLTDQAAYTSPMLAELHGVRQYVVLTNQGVAGVAAKDGEVLWTHRRMPPYRTEVINSPIIQGSFIQVTVGAGNGCELLEVKREDGKFKAVSVYTNKNLSNHHGNVLLLDDHIYGFSEGKGWICQSFKTGDTIWAERTKLRGGSVTYADGRLYCYGEDDGTVVLAEASKSGWKESGRFKIPEQTMLRKPKGKIWTPPVVANGKLYLRDQELLFCYDVKAKE